MITHNAAAGSDLMANSTRAKIGVLVGVKHPFRSALDHWGGGHEVLG
jgi:hypothetical protein